MLVLHVHVHVKPEFVDAFRQASIENASHSIQEPGIARFDLVQQIDDPTQFMLVEAYRNADAQNQHRATAHYQKWRDAVVDMMAEPRSAVKFNSVFPEEKDW